MENKEKEYVVSGMEIDRKRVRVLEMCDKVCRNGMIVKNEICR